MGIGQPWTAGLPRLLSAEGCFGGSITYGLGACKHHERRVAPTPVGWLKALRPNSLSAPACILLAWDALDPPCLAWAKKGKEANSKSQP